MSYASRAVYKKASGAYALRKALITAHAQSDQSLRCPLTESLVTVNIFMNR